jgi:dTDP-glucose pyrophosphorylase
MGSFLGILFCGGRGERLGQITEYISKAFVPVYDRPVFMYPLAQLEASKQIDEIVILTNEDNDAKLRRTGHRTIIQDDARVHDMFSGLAYIREVTGEGRPAVLMPCDNISDIVVDDVIEVFLNEMPEIAISIRKIESKEKLCEMGVFDPRTGTMEYRPRNPKTEWGLIAPYVVRPGVELIGSTERIMNRHQVAWREYKGMWFDIGDVASLVKASETLSRHAEGSKVVD